MTTLDELKAALRPGQVFRRGDLVRLSSNVDRHLAALVKEGRVKKVGQGLYVCPQETPFGAAPPDEEALLRSFLRDDRFVVYSPNLFNGLGLGSTQLYNRRWVFNRKRFGEHRVGGRTYFFHRWREAPKKLSPEFLVVEFLNRLDDLAEDREQMLTRLEEKLTQFNEKKLKYAADHYGTYSTQLKLQRLTERGLNV